MGMLIRGKRGGRRGGAAALALALVLSACGGNSSGTVSPAASGSVAPTSMRFAIFGGGGAQLSWMVRGAKAFEAGHPGLDLATPIGDFYSKPIPYDDLQAAYFGADSPDLVSGYVGGNLRADAAAGNFTDLTDLWNELGLDDAVPPAVADLASVDGHRYWVPTLAQWNPVFYRTDLFTQASIDPPGTWDELLADCRALRAAGIERPLAQAGGDRWTPPSARWFSSIDLALNGADFHQALAEGRIAWSDERVRAVFATWTDLFDAGCYGDPALQSYSDPILELQHGTTAMDNLGEWIYENPVLTNDAPIDFFRPPAISPEVSPTDIVLVYGLAIPAGAAHPDLARDLIRSLVSADSLRTAYRTVPRLILDARVDPGYLPRHTKGLKLLEDARQVTELWEFTATQPQAGIGLTLFTAFLADPSTLDADLATAEQARAAAYGAPAASP